MQSQDNQVINKTSFAQQIYDYLRDSILEGKYSCGSVINAKNVSLELGVSMMPVREALKKLEQTGLLEIKPRSMCLVKTPSQKTIQDALDMRELLELYCVKAIYRTIDEESLLPLKEFQEKMKAALEEQPIDIHSFVSNDWHFHCTLCSLADNEFINSFYPELYIKVNMATMYNIGKKDLDYRIFVKDHEDLINALSSHDSKAVDIISKHLGNSRSNILSGKLFDK